ELEDQEQGGPAPEAAGEDDQDGAETRVLAVRVTREAPPPLDEDEDEEDGAVTRVLDKPKRPRPAAPSQPAAEAPEVASPAGSADALLAAADDADARLEPDSDTTDAQELWIERVASSSRSSWVEAWVG